MYHTEAFSWSALKDGWVINIYTVEGNFLNMSFVPGSISDFKNEYDTITPLWQSSLAMESEIKTTS